MYICVDFKEKGNSLVELTIGMIAGGPASLPSKVSQ